MNSSTHNNQCQSVLLLYLSKLQPGRKISRLFTFIFTLAATLGTILTLPAQTRHDDVGHMAQYIIAPEISRVRFAPPNPALWEKILRGEVNLPEFMTNPELAQESGIDQPLHAPYGPIGTWKALAILIKFSDKNTSVNASYFDTLLFSRTSGASSLHNYYRAVSYGQLDIVGVNLPSTLGWRQAPQTYAYYVNGEYCWNYYSYPHNCQKLAEDAAAAVAPAVDFSQYDNDHDGYVDSIIVIHAGSGAELTGNQNDIWSHAWQTRTQPMYNGVKIRSFITVPEYWLGGGDMTTGVYAHELGHVFGLPDLYDTTKLPDGTNTTEGVGEWSLMGSGCWNGPLKPSGYRLGDYPAFLDAWSRLQLSWSTVTDVYGNSTRNINNAETDSAAIFRTWLFGGGSQEYFLVENRQKTGFDAYLPGSGLLIWHIDDAIPKRYGGGVNDYACSDRDNWHCTYPTHFRVALEQADGLWNLENKNGVRNRGDAGDSWPGSSKKRSFTWSTTPSTSSYYTNADTQVAVTNIGNSGATMSVQFTTLPTAFDKIAPANDVTMQPLNLTLSWGISTGATSYEYCYDTINNAICDTSWNSTGTSTSASLSGLSTGTTYYWQVRGIALSGSTFMREANGGWWRFTTSALPGIFYKTNPANDATGQSVNPILLWSSSSGASNYEYCYDITNNNACDTSWISAGTNTSVNLSNLNFTTVYYWQVRAKNTHGETYADNGNWWKFATQPPAQYPGPFNKVSPPSGATDQPTSLTLSWQSTSPLTLFEYCIDTINDDLCEGDNWVSVGTNTSVNPPGLVNGKTYYWHVRAWNGTAGPTYSGIGSTAFWNFSTVSIPTAFTKLCPPNEVPGQPGTYTFYWGPYIGKLKQYQICIDPDTNTKCNSGWRKKIMSTSYTTTLGAKRTYCWQVRAKTPVSTVWPVEGNKAWCCFTTGP